MKPFSFKWNLFFMIKYMIVSKSFEVIYLQVRYILHERIWSFLKLLLSVKIMWTILEWCSFKWLYLLWWSIIVGKDNENWCIIFNKCEDCWDGRKYKCWYSLCWSMIVGEDNVSLFIIFNQSGDYSGWLKINMLKKSQIA